MDLWQTLNWISYIRRHQTKTAGAGRDQSFLWQFPRADSVSWRKYILPDRDILLNPKLNRKAAGWSEVRGWWICCGTSLLYPKAADNRSGGRTCASFASIVCCPALCEWRGVLHTGNYAVALVPLHVYLARSKQRTHVYTNVSHCYRWCTILFPLLLLRFRRTGSLLSSCSEKVVVTICHTRWDEPMKNSTASSHIQWDISQRSQEWVHPVDTWMSYGTKMFLRQRGAQSDGLGTSCIPTIPSSVIWGHSKFRRERAGCPVVPQCRFLSGPMICCTVFLYVGSVEGGAGRDQWANVWGSVGGPEVNKRPPLPFHISMCLSFTCETWASTPCSNHTLKTGTPC